MNTGKIIIISVAIILVVALLGMATKALSSGGFSSGNLNSASQTTSSSSQPSNTNIQEASIKVVGGTYVMEPSTFKKGVPVRMTADMKTFYGCSRSIVIPDFGVRKTLSATSNVIEFTPTKSGTFNIACSMNMYRGQFTVTDSGSASTSGSEQAAAPVISTPTQSPSIKIVSSPGGSVGGGCTMGAGGGGCGCGG